MTSYHNLLVFYLLTLWSSFCYGQSIVFRGDTRTPEEIQRAGGFWPRGASRALEVTPNISMYNHALGAPNGQSTDIDGYVSTSSDELIADRFVGTLGGTGYVYQIAATPNFINVENTLRHYSPFPDEQEFAALGGFRWEQVVGWTYFRGNIRQNYTPNPNYNGARFNSQRPSNGEPSLAGFPNGHQAWREAPWNAFANGNCGGSAKFRLRLRQTNCGPSQTNQQSATAYLDKSCPAGTC